MTRIQSEILMALV